MRKKNSGVSPVIGVVLMVAITVIMGVVIAEFVFNLTDRFTPSASANVNFNQNLYWSGGDYSYNVTATVDSMQGSNYLAVTAPTADSADFQATRVGADVAPSEVVTPSDVDSAPDNPSGSPSIDSTDDGRILVRAGDRVRVGGLQAGDVVQVFGGVEGEETLVVEYTVQDVVPDAYEP